MGRRFCLYREKGTTLLTAYEENGWKTFSTVLNKDEKLTLSFSESGSSYYVRLKDFAAAAAHTLTLNTPAGATVVLKDRSGAEITGKTAHTPLPPVPMPTPSASSATRPRRGASPLMPM